MELNDGYFEVLLIRKPKNPADISNLVAGLLQKEEKENDQVYKFKTRSIRFRSSEPVDWVLDGEFGGTKTEVFVENLNKCLEIKRNK